MASKEFERALAALKTEVPELVHRDFSAIVRRELTEAEVRGAAKLASLESALAFLDKSYSASPSASNAVMRNYPSDPERNCVLTIGDIMSAATELGWSGKAGE